MAEYLAQLDSLIADTVADWTHLTTFLAVIIVIFVAYPILSPSEPDTHPLLLARQANASPVRQKNSSALYRSPEVPHGYPLRSGLNVRDAGAPKWANGKDGDLRDVWREVTRGGKENGEGKVLPEGVIMTVLGKEQVVEHEIDSITKEIAVMGQLLKQNNASRVAIYLPNCVEYLVVIFACAFYGQTPVLLPYNMPHPKIYELLKSAKVDTIICAAGKIPLDDLAKECPNLDRLTWIVEKTGRHMDWNGEPGAAKGRVSVTVWHDILASKEEEVSAAPAKAQLPSNADGASPGDIVTIWQSADLAQPAEIVTFTQRNIVSAIAALISALPTRQRLNSGDLVLPADGFAHTYILCQTLAALYVHASVAITSVAVPGVDLTLASRSISPTVILASAESMADRHARETGGIQSSLQKFGKYSSD